MWGIYYEANMSVKKNFQGSVWAERSVLSDDTTSTANTSLVLTGCSHLVLARVSVAEWTSHECQRGVRMIPGLSSIRFQISGSVCDHNSSAPKCVCVCVCDATARRHMQKEQCNVVYHPRTDDSYRRPPWWQKTLKQQRGLIFSNGMQCTVNKRDERAEEETAESAVDSELRWPFRGAGWKVRAPSKYRGGSA